MYDLAKFEYYSSRDMLDEDGWFYCTTDDLEESTTLSWKVQSRIINTLIEYQLIYSKLKGVPAKRYFKIIGLPIDIFS